MEGVRLDGSHPEEQGLKPDHRIVFNGGIHLDGSHPEEQGLKLRDTTGPVPGRVLDGSHPEEQGLKQYEAGQTAVAMAALMGVIQKNKD